MNEHMLSPDSKKLVERIKYKLRQHNSLSGISSSPRTFDILINNTFSSLKDKEKLWLLKRICADLDELVLNIRIEFPDMFGFKEENNRELDSFGWFGFSSYFDETKEEYYDLNKSYQKNNINYYNHNKIRSYYEYLTLSNNSLLFFIETLFFK